MWKTFNKFVIIY